MTYDSHRINLLPVAVKTRQQGRQVVTLMAAVCAGVVVLLGFLWFQKGQQISSVRSDITAQQLVNTKLQAEIRELDYIEAKYNAVTAKEELVKDSWSGEVSWYRVLQDVATTMPSQTWLTQFQAQRESLGSSTGQPVTTEALIQQAGSFTVQGVGFDHPDSADWLARIAQMREVVNLWLSQSSASGGEGDAQRTVTFGSSGSLTSDAWSPRAKRADSGNLYEGTNAE